MTISDGKPEFITGSRFSLEIHYKELSKEERDKHLMDLVRALARRAAREDHYNAIAQKISPKTA